MNAISLVYYVSTCAFFIALLSIIGTQGKRGASALACLSLAASALSAFTGHIAHEGVFPEKLYYMGLGLQVLAISTAAAALWLYIVDR